MDPAAVAGALAAHDRVKRSTDLPLFFGRKEKDTITAHQLINRFLTASEIAGWDDARKCNELKILLRDQALIWWDALPNMSEHDDVQTDWPHLKAAFLDAYAPTYTAKATCTMFAEMQQRNGETVLDYYLRVDDALKKLCEAKPIAMSTTVTMALPAGTNLANALLLKNEGIKQDELFFLHQLFVAGLKEDIRAKVMEANLPTVRESLKVARDTEVVYNDRKSKAAHISKIQEDNQSEGEENEVNVIRGRDGKFQSSHKTITGGTGNSNNKGRETKPKFEGNCRYCKKYGHSQKFCFTRKEKNAPMVDAQGQPYKAGPRKVHNIQEEDMPRGDDNNQHFNSLNW